MSTSITALCLYFRKAVAQTAMTSVKDKVLVCIRWSRRCQASTGQALPLSMVYVSFQSPLKLLPGS
jgi:hypothetical protein